MAPHVPIRSSTSFRLAIASFAVAISLFTACGQPSDRPEDCTENQYFDETLEQCVTCQAVAEPECSPGCPFIIEDDPDGCPLARCLSGDECDRCDETSFYSDDTLTCEPCDGPETCSEGEPTRILRDGGCITRCPESAPGQ